MARDHLASVSQFVLPRLTPQHLGELLRAGAAAAQDSSLVAAVELLIAHGHWLGYGYLRQYVDLQWDGDGRPLAVVDWWRLRDALGEARRAVRALAQADAPPAALAALERWLAERGVQQVQGSSSELAVLRVAASLVCGHEISLYADLGSLGNANRGRVLTAIGHLLSHGGNLPMQASLTWGRR